MLALKISFIVAVVVANLAVTHYGKWALPFTAFFLIPFDMVARDLIHRKLGYRPTKRMMFEHIGTIILIGGLLSYFINQDSKQIAIASSLTFIAVGLVNTVIYEWCRHLKESARMIFSNFIASLVDSAMFQLIAFGVLDVSLFITQSAAKTIGGVFWILVLLGVLIIRGLWRSK